MFFVFPFKQCGCPTNQSNHTKLYVQIHHQGIMIKNSQFILVDMDHPKGRSGCESVCHLVHSVLHIYEHTVSALVLMTKLFQSIFAFVVVSGLRFSSLASHVMMLSAPIHFTLILAAFQVLQISSTE